MKPYACHNRAPYKTLQPVQAGWYADGYTRTPRMEALPFRMSPDCQYCKTDLGKDDARCDGCEWRTP